MKKSFDPKNDIVFTPDNIAELMCQIAGVNAESVVIDNTAGAGSLLIAAKRAGAKRCIGIECDDVAFNMLKENLNTSGYEIVKGDGLNYKDLVEHPEEINVAILNPPYSFEDSGFIFADTIMQNMKSGVAVVLTKGNAKRENILKHSTLKAVIKMPDIFKGYASLSSALYVFECGRPHKEEDAVKFIDFSNDGYKRSGRKSQKGKLFAIPGEEPEEKYKELVRYINGGSLQYFKDVAFEDTLKENPDWSYMLHRKIDNTPTEEDFKKTVAEYLSFRVGQTLRGEG